MLKASSSSSAPINQQQQQQQVLPTSSSSPNHIKSQHIQKELFKLKLQKRYPFLSKWKILCFEFFDENFESSIKVENTNVRFEFELSEQILDSSSSTVATTSEDGTTTNIDQQNRQNRHKRTRNSKSNRQNRRHHLQQQQQQQQQNEFPGAANDEAQSLDSFTSTEESDDEDEDDDDEDDFLTSDYEYEVTGNRDREDDDGAYSIIEDEFILRGDIVWHDDESKTQQRASLNYDDLIRPILECKLFEYDVRLQLLKFNGPNVKLSFDISFEKKDRKSSSSDDDDLETTKVNEEEEKKQDESEEKEEEEEEEDVNAVMILKNSRDKIRLVCQKASSSDSYDKSYDLSSMFNNEFLADCKIKSSNGQIFHVHKSIMWLTLKDKTETFLNKLNKHNFDSDSLELLLFYCYSDCLPLRLDLKTSATFALSNPNNSTDTASNNNTTGDQLLSLGDEARLKSLVQFLEEYDELSDLNQLLKVYMNNFSFKLNTDKLINEIKNCFEAINVQFRYDDNNVIYQRLFLNSSKLCQVIKTSFEQLYLGLVKIIRLLNMYSQKQEQLSKEEKSEFIKKVKNSLPFFLSQLERFLSSIHKHSLQMTDANKREMAEYMIPEIDVFVSNSLELIKSSELVIERIVNSKKASEQNSTTTRNKEDESGGESGGEGLSSEDDNTLVANAKSSSAAIGGKISKKSKKLKTKLGKTIKNAMHLRELKKIQKFNEKVNKSFRRIEEIFEKYENTNQDAKVNLVHKELSSFIDNIVHDIPRVLRKLKDYSNDQSMLLNKALKIYDFKFAFKLLASKNEWFLSELKSNRQIVNPYIVNLCNKLQNSELNKELEKLDLAPQITINPNDVLPLNFVSNVNSNNKANRDFDSFFKSKPAENNRLSREAIELFKSKHQADLWLELHDDERNEVQLLKVHGCIVASRCVWFQRALSSGMKESIDRKVVLHDRNLDLFSSCFIEYLYSGRLNDECYMSNSSDSAAASAAAAPTKLTNDDLIELLTIADKYECDSLKDIIEKKLIAFIRRQYDIVLKEQKLPSQPNEPYNSSSSFLLVLIDYLNLSEHFKLDMLMALCISILVEHIDLNNNVNSNTTNVNNSSSSKKFDLDTIEEYKQLTPTLQALIKDKRIQYTRAKELQRLKQKRKEFREEMCVLNVNDVRYSQTGRSNLHHHHPDLWHLNYNQDGVASASFDEEDDEFDENTAGNHLMTDDNDSFASARLSRLSELMMPPMTPYPPTQYHSSSNLSVLEGAAAATVRQPPLSRLDELVALAHPLIVLDGILLENSFNQLKEIIGEVEVNSSDEQLVKLLIRHDCDLNRVVPIVLNFE